MAERQTAQTIHVSSGENATNSEHVDYRSNRANAPYYAAPMGGNYRPPPPPPSSSSRPNYHHQNPNAPSHHQHQHHHHHHYNNNNNRNNPSMPRRNSSGALSNNNSNNSNYRARGRSKPRDNHRNTALMGGATPSMRMKDRNMILSMQRHGVRMANLPPHEVAVRVIGVDTSFMKNPENPQISDKIGTPGFFPTQMSFPEEKFRMHAVRNTAFVSPLPRGFGTNWHLQYSFFTDKKFPVFDHVAQAAEAIAHIQVDEEKDPAATGETAFTTYLIRNVRRIDERTSHLWMSELAARKRSLQDLVQTYGVPFKQWRPVPNMSKCPLLEFVVRYRPGLAEASWFIRLNVIYTEMNEIKRDSQVRLGDWFFHPRRLQRRAQGWTDQLIDFMHSIARQASKVGATASSTNVINRLKSATVCCLKNKLHGDGGSTVPVASPPVGAAATAPSTSQLSFHQQWSYVLKLSEYQLKLGLLDRCRYFDGLLSLLQKTLTPARPRNGNCSAAIAIGVNELMELVLLIQRLLPVMLESSDCIILLVKTLLQHLRYVVPPTMPPLQEFSSLLQEELVVALCQMLRQILLHGDDILVRIEDHAPSTWPSIVLDPLSFPTTTCSAEDIRTCIACCRQKRQEVAGRITRLQQTSPLSLTMGSMRNEAQLIQSLDRFHRVDASIDLQRVYNEVFVPVQESHQDLPVDVAAIFLICEWAVTSHRPAEYRFLSALSLLEMHSNTVLQYGKEKGMLNCRETDHVVVLQSALQQFLKLYEPKAITEVTQLIDLFCLLTRRRVFSVEQFIEFAAFQCEMNETRAPPKPSRDPASSATVVSTAYNIECSPGKGYKSSDVHLLSATDRLKLYLWQLPRGPFPLPTCLPMEPVDSYDAEVYFLKWMDVLEIRREHLQYSKTLERAQSLCIYVFHTHGQANDRLDAGNANRVLKEVEYQGKVGELVSAVKTMCGHDKGRFSRWFLEKIYHEPNFFRFSDFGSVEHIVRLVCLILEIVDTLALLEVLIYFVRHSPPFLVKNVVLAMIERHEMAFCATDQIPFLLQTFVDRFQRMPKAADDKVGTIAKFFVKMYYVHATKKELAKLDLPFALIRQIAEVARKKKEEENSQKPKEMALEVTNPIVRIPPPREVIPSDLKSALSRSFKALQVKTFDDGMVESDKASTPQPPTVATPSNNEGTNTTAVDPAFEAPPYASLVWKDLVGESTALSEKNARDSAIEYAVATINNCMTSTVGATNLNATRERRTPNYVFFLRAILSEVMDKWMASLSVRVKNNCRRPIVTPHYMHRCVRLIREIVDQHPDGEDFQEKFSNTLLVWLQKEVLPGFSGSETQKRTRNPFINVETGKETFVLNQKGRLDKVQYGLKAFLVSLVIHKVVDLTQILRLVLVPLFPRLRRASRDPPPNLPSQLLAMALVFQLFSEPPQHVPVESQKLVMFDEPLTKYHLRFLRTQVPACLMFPLVHLLCQISYQMEDNFLLRKREERGTLASITLFNLTSDGIVRDTIFHDTKEAREKHILPVYHKKQWHTAVLLTHFFRPPNSPAEDANGQVQLLKVEQIIDQMNVWVLNRGGSIYLDLQMSRQQMKVKRSKRNNNNNTTPTNKQSKRKATSDINTRPTKRADVNGLSDDPATYGSEERATKYYNGVASGLLDPLSSDDEELDLEVDDSSSPTEILANLIVLRTLKRSSRPASLSSPTLCAVSPITTPQFYAMMPQPQPSPVDHVTMMATPSSAWSSDCRLMQQPTNTEIWMALAAKDAQEAALASLYSATVCSISRRAMGSVIAKILQVLEDDVKYTQKDKFGRKLNGTSVVRLICGIMLTPPGSAFLPRYMMSLAVQLEWLYEGCVVYERDPSSFSLSFVRQMRRKLAIRLQLVGVIAHSKHVALTICYRDRIVKTLFSLLGTSVVSSDVGLSLFSWMLDLIPLVNASVLHERQSELVASLGLPDRLQRRVWSVFPRPTTSSQSLTIQTANGERAVDPWGLLELLPELPSDALVPTLADKAPRTRRVYHYCAA